MGSNCRDIGQTGKMMRPLFSIAFHILLLPFLQTLSSDTTTLYPAQHVAFSCSLRNSLLHSHFANKRWCPQPRKGRSPQGHTDHNRARVHILWNSVKSAAGLSEQSRTALQTRLWEQLDVLPSIDETPIQLEVTQDTAFCNLGFIAAKSIEFGEVLVSVPWRFAISVDAEDRRGGPSDMRLALKLLDTINDSSDPYSDKQRKEIWRFYMHEVLPKYSNAAVLWSEAEIEEIQFENCIEFVRAFKNQIDEYCTNYLEAGGTATEEQLRWALGVVRSRSFLVDMPGDNSRRQRALVPVADLFNHLPEAPAEWAAAELAGAGANSDEDLISGNPWRAVEGDDGQVYLDVYSHRAWPAGAEVLLPYGLETNLELLASHGVVLGSNPADYTPLFQDLVELVGAVAELDLREDETAARAKLKLLESADAAAAPLAVRPGATPAETAAHLLGFLQAAYAAPAELPAFEEVYCPAAGHYILAPQLAAAGGGGGGGGEMVMDARRAEELAGAARRKVVELCEEELARLPTTLDSDIAALAQLERPGGPHASPAAAAAVGGAVVAAATTAVAPAVAAERRRLALQFRASQKRLLRNARDVCARAGGGVAAPAAASVSPSSGAAGQGP